MKEFFHGWRKKAGCITLLMACAVSAEWLSSYKRLNGIQFSTKEYRHQDVLSLCGNIYWCAYDNYEMRWSPCRIAASPEPAEVLQNWLLHQIEERQGDRNGIALIIPYWLIVLPVTLLSAFLLLWKPQKHA